MDESLIMAAQAAGFLAALWFVGFVFRSMQLSSLVGEILVGIAMGPGGFDIVPESDGFAVLGKLGIFWLMFDGGAHLELGLLREMGPRAFLVALTGLVSPLCATWGAMVLAGFTPLQGFVIGTALAPTSAGMTVKLMADAGVLQTKIGQMIVCAAMTDDVLSLIILAIVSNLSGAGDLSLSAALVMDICLPLVSSLGFIAVGGMSWVLMPKLLSGLPGTLVAPLMVAWSTVLALLCNYAHSSEYMGVFLAGMSFAQVRLAPWPVDEASAEPASKVVEVEQPSAEEVEKPSAEEVEKVSAKHAGNGEAEGPEGSEVAALVPVPVWLEKDSAMVLQSFLVSIFFASAGFNVAVEVLFNPNTLLLGFLCAVVGLVGKLVAGAWFPGHRMCVGMAMASRGELGLVMASQALALGLTPSKGFNVTVWGVLLNTLVAPPLFQILLKRMSSKDEAPEITAFQGEPAKV